MSDPREERRRLSEKWWREQAIPSSELPPEPLFSEPRERSASDDFYWEITNAPPPPPPTPWEQFQQKCKEVAKLIGLFLLVCLGLAIAWQTFLAILTEGMPSGPPYGLDDWENN
jgi:hypothetical protein